MSRDRVGEATRGWQRLTGALIANAAELPHLEEHRERLIDLLETIRDLTRQQAALTASKQEVTKTLQAKLAEAYKVAAFLRSGVREKYGKTAEKLVEFGLRVFRGLRRQQEAEEPQPDPEPPGVEIAAESPDCPD